MVIRSLTTYTLQVRGNGKIYEATSTMPSRTKIDSIGYSYYPNKVLVHEKGYYPIIYFTNPPNEKNYYLFKFNGAGLVSPQLDVIISSDDGTFGNIQSFESPFVYEENKTARIELYSITKEAYDFYYAIREQLRNDGGFFSAPPANVPSNFNNGALGFFQTSPVDTVSIKFP
jgi:hypothetical protein